MSILHTHRRRMTYVERCRIYVEGDRVVYAVSDESLTRVWNVPTCNTSFLLMGPGSSITNAAMRILSEDGVILGATGTSATPLFYGSLSDYRPTALLQQWVQFWGHENARLEVAKLLARERCSNLACFSRHGSGSILLQNMEAAFHAANFEASLSLSTSVTELMGYEANLAKNLYRAAAKSTEVRWDGRDNRGKREDKDVINRLIDDGNYILYGYSSLALWCLGLVPQMPVTHGASRRGGLVFDIADTIKDAVSLPAAFEWAAQGRAPGSDFRRLIIERCEERGVLDYLLALLPRAAETGITSMHQNGVDPALDTSKGVVSRSTLQVME